MASIRLLKSAMLAHAIIFGSKKPRVSTKQQLIAVITVSMQPELVIVLVATSSPNSATSASYEIATLESIIITTGSDKHRPTLSQKLNIAAMLAGPLLEFHAHGWIHKAVCSGDTLFFHPSESTSKVPTCSSPLKLGSNSQDLIQSVHQKRLDFFGGTGFDVFCHPDMDETIKGKGVGMHPVAVQEIFGVHMPSQNRGLCTR